MSDGLIDIPEPVAKEEKAAAVRSRPSREVGRLCRLVADHERLRSRSIPLVPTENLLSPIAAAMLGSDLANRYYLTDSDVWEYPQTELIAELSAVARDAFASLYRAGHVNIRPLSGLSCMTAVLAALTSVGDTVMTLSPNDGGHGATRVVAERLGLRVAYLPIDVHAQRVDISRYVGAVERRPPRLVYFDHSNLLKPLPLDELVDATPDGTFVYYDCSQLLGLMVDPEYWDPRAAGVALIGGSLHKTFPGPQKAGLFTDDDALAESLERVTNSFVSSHHVNSVAAAAVTACEMMRFGCEFSRQIRANARALGDALREQELDVQTVDGTVSECHQVWLAAPGGPAAASGAVRELTEAGIVVNCARIPTLGGEKGLRLGSTEATRLGMAEEEMRAIAKLIADCLRRRRPAAEIAKQAASLREAFQGARYCFASLEEAREHVG